MPYAEIYSNRQVMQGMASSNDQSLGMTQSPNVDTGLTLKGGIGLMNVANQLKPVAGQIVNVAISNQGSIKLDQEWAAAQTLFQFGITTATLGLPAAIGTQALILVGETIQTLNNRNRANIEQEMNQKIMGARVNKFASGGSYYG